MLRHLREIPRSGTSVHERGRRRPPHGWVTRLTPRTRRIHVGTRPSGRVGASVPSVLDGCLSVWPEPIHPRFPGEDRKPRRIFRDPPVVCELPSGSARGTHASPGGPRVARCEASLRGCVQRRSARASSGARLLRGLRIERWARDSKPGLPSERKLRDGALEVARTAFGRSGRPTASGHLRVSRHRSDGPSGLALESSDPLRGPSGGGASVRPSGRTHGPRPIPAPTCRAARKRGSLRVASEPGRRSPDLRVRWQQGPRSQTNPRAICLPRALGPWDVPHGGDAGWCEGRGPALARATSAAGRNVTIQSPGEHRLEPWRKRCGSRTDSPGGAKP